MARLSAVDYLQEPVSDRVTYEEFHKSPFSAFLRQAVHLADAFNSCIRHFPRKRVRTDEYTKDSQHSMQEIASPLLVSLMSNLELLERIVYAELFDLTPRIPDFSARDVLQSLKSADVEVGLRHILGYRGERAAAGRIVADALTGWQDPRKVNTYFEALLNVKPFYPDELAEELAVMWQIRHSIVHTGGTLTSPDAQRAVDLQRYGNRAMVFRYQFVDAVVKRLHHILRDVCSGFHPKVKSRFGQGYEGQVKTRIDELFLLESPRRSWLGRNP